MRLAISLLLLYVFFAGSCSADDLVEGERLYQIHCAGCHGPKGEGGRGTTLAAPTLPRASTEGALINVIARGIPGTEMLAARLEAQQIRQIATWVRALGRQPLTQPAGNAQRGERLYLGKGNCASCHAIRTKGGVSGPDLTEIGLRRGSEYLRKALLDPEADVPENFSQYRWHTVIPDNFLQVRVVTKGGRRITGARINEDTFSIQVRDLSGRVRSFSKSDLAELHL
jgi:putative heme-binding domain-containing protein